MIRLFLAFMALLMVAQSALATVSTISGFTTRADGGSINSTAWNAEVGGIYTYINNNLVPVLNLAASKGDLITYNGAAHVVFSTGGATNDNKVLTADSTAASGWRLATTSASLPNTATGGILVGTGVNTYGNVAIGISGTVLTSDGTTAAWATNAGVPAGVIAIWSGSIATIPSGWHLCDGTNGTPNLQGLMIAGAGNVSPAATGGLGLKNPAATGTFDHSHVYTATNGGFLSTVSTTFTTPTPKWYALAFIQKL